MPDDEPRSPGVLERLRLALRKPDDGTSAGPHLTGGATTDVTVAAAARLRVANVARFDTLRVADVMVPRADILSVDVETPLVEAGRMFAESAHSRMPVFRGNLDEPLGLLHIRDLLPHLLPSPDGTRTLPTSLGQLLRPLLYAPPSMPAADLLLRMQTKRIHMALVVDEFGGTDGLVTLEDLVEEIVGDIADEHDDPEAPTIKQVGPASWEVAARTEIEDLEAKIGRDLDLEDDAAEEVDTIGGLVFTLAGRVPERGEVIHHPAGFDFVVQDADPRRIKSVVVRPHKPAIGAQTAGQKLLPAPEAAAD